jgi:hypothetical protein
LAAAVGIAGVAVLGNIQSAIGQVFLNWGRDVALLWEPPPPL